MPLTTSFYQRNINSGLKVQSCDMHRDWLGRLGLELFCAGSLIGLQVRELALVSVLFDQAYSAAGKAQWHAPLKSVHPRLNGISESLAALWLASPRFEK